MKKNILYYKKKKKKANCESNLSIQLLFIYICLFYSVVGTYVIFKKI